MKFSVIIPVFNVEKYLKECIESLIEQTYDNYEIILVNDGSTDLSGEICEEYKKKNSKINVIHQENSGLSIARNVGINNATGDYILFIDSDDYICDKNFLTNIYQALKNTNSELLIFGHKKFFEKSGKFIEKKIFEKKINESIIESLIKQNYLKASACDKVIKRNVLIDNKIYFPEKRFSEDIKWCADLLEKIDLDNVIVLNENVYVYRQRSNSITKSVKEKNIKDMYEMIFDKYRSTTNIYVKHFLAYEYSVVLGLMETNIELNNDLKKKIYEMKEILDYNLSDKVKKVKKIVSLLGIKFASKCLAIYIYIK